MGIWALLTENIFNFVGAAGVIGSLWFTAVSLRSETRTRRIANLLTITANHRELWKIFLTNKELARVRDNMADTRTLPVAQAEWVFVGMVIQHSSSVYQAMKDQLVVKLEGLRRDIAEFFSLPVPREIWEKTKVLQNDDFVAFVESCRNWK